jgi:hypothetical protein
MTNGGYEFYDDRPEHVLLPPELWQERDSEGFMIKDPIADTDYLNPDQPPAFLLENRDLGDMAEHMRILHADTALNIYYSNGQHSSDELGPDFDSIMDAEQFDAIGHSVDGVLKSNTRERSLLPQLQNDYSERIAMKALLTGAASFCVGLEVDMAGKPATRTERAIQAIQGVAQLNRIEPSERGGGQWLYDTVAANARQWYVALQTGVRLTHMANTLRDQGRDMEKAALIVPYHDADLGRKLSALGMNNLGEQDLIPGSFDADTDASDVELFTRTGRIDFTSFEE